MRRMRWVIRMLGVIRVIWMLFFVLAHALSL
jgi:hypothetical protein